MSSHTFDRETLLDLTVNVIPLGIILFFVVIFAVSNPFGVAPAASAIQFAILLVTFAALAILTYYSGKAISEAESELEEEPAEHGELPVDETAPTVAQEAAGEDDGNEDADDKEPAIQRVE